MLAIHSLSKCHLNLRQNMLKCYKMKEFNLLTPNVNHIGRTAPLASKVAFYIFIQQI